MKLFEICGNVLGELEEPRDIVGREGFLGLFWYLGDGQIRRSIDEECFNVLTSSIGGFGGGIDSTGDFGEMDLLCDFLMCLFLKSLDYLSVNGRGDGKALCLTHLLENETSQCGHGNGLWLDSR